MRLLLISNSTNAGEEYLGHSIPKIEKFLGQSKPKALFIPYAAVTFSFDKYLEIVAEKFATIGLEVQSVHNFDNPKKAVEQAEMIVVGGGNTFHLLKLMYENDLVDAIADKVKSGTPYIGWSAGSNMACPTIRTTNDMPIVEPPSFNALGLVPFQINPHYLDANPDGHAGETREQRINEFIEVNRDIFVVGLREGTALVVEDNKMTMLGERNARIFRYGQTPQELTPDDDFSFLLK